MAYPEFDPLRPDPSTDNGSDAFTVTRENLLALRDAALVGGMPGWALALSGGTAAQRTTWIYSRGTERLRLLITWGTSGGPNGKPQTIEASYSSNSGSTYDAIGTTTLTYDPSGNLTGASGLSPGLAAHWLLGNPERIRLLEADYNSHKSASNPHPGSASTEALNNHASAGNNVHGVPAGKSIWHSGNLAFAYNGTTQTLSITAS